MVMGVRTNIRPSGPGRFPEIITNISTVPCFCLTVICWWRSTWAGSDMGPACLNGMDGCYKYRRMGMRSNRLLRDSAHRPVLDSMPTAIFFIRKTRVIRWGLEISLTLNKVIVQEIALVFNGPMYPQHLCR